MTFHQPFDLYYWLVTLFAGNMTIFLAVSFVVIATLAAMFNMAGIVVGIIFSLFIILLAVYTGSIYLLIIAVLGLVIGFTIARMFK